MLRSLSFLLFCFFASQVHAQTLRFYQISDIADYQLVLEKALEEEKMIFIALYEDGGEFEEMVRAGVFRQDSLIEAYEDLIPIATEVDSEMGSRFLESFGAETLPTFYYLSQNELLSYRHSGLMMSADLLKALEQARKNAETYEALQQKYVDNQLSTSDWLQLLEIYEINFNYFRTRDLAMEFLAELSNEELLQERVRPWLFSYGLDLETHYPKLMIAHKAELSDSVFQRYYEAAYSYNLDLAIANEDTALLQVIVDSLIPAGSESDSLQKRMQFETQKVFAAETKIFSTWRDAALNYSKQLETDSLRSDFIFREAYEIAENFNSDEAHTVARRLAAEAFDLHEDFRYKMLEAYMAYLLKDFEAAEKLVSQAEQTTGIEQNLQKAEALRSMILKEKSKE